LGKVFLLLGKTTHAGKDSFRRGVLFLNARLRASLSTRVFVTIRRSRGISSASPRRFPCLIIPLNACLRASLSTRVFVTIRRSMGISSASPRRFPCLIILLNARLRASLSTRVLVTIRRSRGASSLRSSISLPLYFIILSS